MLDNVEDVNVELRGMPAVGLYLFLQRHEEELDGHTLAVLNDLERELFRHLSIEEMERLETAYRDEG
jgi:hypothetical protein